MGLGNAKECKGSVI